MKRIRKRNIVILGIVSIGLSLLLITGVALLSDQILFTSDEELSAILSNSRSNTDTVLQYEEEIPTHPPISPGDSSSGDSSAGPRTPVANPPPTATPTPIVTPTLPTPVAPTPEETFLSTLSVTPTLQPPFPVVPMGVIMGVVVSMILLIGGVPYMYRRSNFNPRTKR